MAEVGFLIPWRLPGIPPGSDVFWREIGGGGWATAIVLLLLLLWQLLRALSRRRCAPLAISAPVPTLSSNADPSAGISKIITDTDLQDLINSLEGKTKQTERWEDVINKKNAYVSYNAKCCRPKDGPLKYLSVAIFERCSTELLRDFYMDNEYRKEWDKTLVEHKRLQVDEASGIEIGHTIKKFLFLMPREYILAWRVWEGKDKTFYCFIRDCEHPLAPRQKKYVRVGIFRSGWRIRKVPGRDSCEITMVHQEDGGMNVEMAKLAFAKGIWSYVCKMNSALRGYSSLGRKRSSSIMTALRLIQKVPTALDAAVPASYQGLSGGSGGSVFDSNTVGGDAPDNEFRRNPSKKWITNGLLLLGGIVCLSRGRSTLGTQLAMACMLKKLIKNGPAPGQIERGRVARDSHEGRCNS